MVNVLIIEKQGQIQRAIEARKPHHVVVDSVATMEAAREIAAKANFDIVICDADENPSERLKFSHTLQKLARQSPKAKIIIVSDTEEPPITNLAGARYQWVPRPIDDVDLGALIMPALKEPANTGQPQLGDRDIRVPTEFEGILAISLPMRLVIQHVVEAAMVDAPVLVTGETGTGKDLVARAIHKRSKRKKNPFVPVNMGAIPSELIASELFGHDKGAYTGATENHEGVFEQARGGTIFLDEITTMNDKTQVSLLRVLETQTIRRVGGTRNIDVDTQIIAATNEDIEEAVKSRRFREDLYYRLDVIRIHLPPLRERPGDVSFLTNHFISRFDAAYHKTIRVASSQIYQLLRSYPWPGNVRELKNVIQRAVVMATGSELVPELLPARIRQASGAKDESVVPKSRIQVGMSLAEAEKILIAETLSSVGSNKSKAAAILGISRHALYDKLKRYGLL